MVGGAVSSWRPPWFETQIELNPWSRHLTASSARTTPFRARLPPHSLASHSASFQSKSGHSWELMKLAIDSAGTSLLMLAYVYTSCVSRSQVHAGRLMASTICCTE